MCMSLSTPLNGPERETFLEGHKKAERNVIVHYGAGGRASSASKERLLVEVFQNHSERKQ